MVRNSLRIKIFNLIVKTIVGVLFSLSQKKPRQPHPSHRNPHQTNFFFFFFGFLRFHFFHLPHLIRHSNCCISLSSHFFDFSVRLSLFPLCLAIKASTYYFLTLFSLLQGLNCLLSCLTVTAC